MEGDDRRVIGNVSHSVVCWKPKYTIGSFLRLRGGGE